MTGGVMVVYNEDPTRHKFTDEDVRTNPILVDLAERYLQGYEGDFIFLRKIRREFLGGSELTVGMVRGVLNCMRNEPRYAEMLRQLRLVPGAPALDLATVTDIRTRMTPQQAAPRQRVVIDRECWFTDGRPWSHTSHEWHSDDLDDPTSYKCPGFRFKINRVRSYKIPLSVSDKYNFVRARTGKLVHELAGGGYVLWSPETHNVGFTYPPMLVYYTRCRYPSEIRNGILLEHRLTPTESIAAGGLDECPHCATAEDTRC